MEPGARGIPFLELGGSALNEATQIYATESGDANLSGPVLGWAN